MFITIVADPSGSGSAFLKFPYLSGKHYKINIQYMCYIIYLQLVNIFICSSSFTSLSLSPSLYIYLFKLSFVHHSLPILISLSYILLAFFSLYPNLSILISPFSLYHYILLSLFSSYVSFLTLLSLFLYSIVQYIILRHFLSIDSNLPVLLSPFSLFLLIYLSSFHHSLYLLILIYL